MITRPITHGPKRPTSIWFKGPGIGRLALSVVVLSALALVASACGDGTSLDQIAEETLATEQATTSTVAPDGSDDPPTSTKPDDSTESPTAGEFSDQEQAVLDYLRRGASVPPAESRCLVDGMNLASIDASSILDATLTEPDDLALTDLILTCFEDPELLAGFVENFAAGFAVSAGFDPSIDQAACMVAALADNNAASELAVASLSPAVQDALEACVSQGDPAVDTAGLFEPGSTYGDNPALDALWDACQAGAMASCDELYSTSEIGSEYETFGATCGQQEPNSSGGTCDIPFSYGDNTDLDALWDACEAGDGASCDKLYFDSPVGSVYETFGDTCGNRYDESPGFCEDAIG
jgi:hypothetical protein